MLLRERERESGREIKDSMCKAAEIVFQSVCLGMQSAIKLSTSSDRTQMKCTAAFPATSSTVG